MTWRPAPKFVVLNGRLQASKIPVYKQGVGEWSADGIPGWSQKGSFIGQRITATMLSKPSPEC